MSILIGLAYSPWTRKARWALDHHGHPYKFVEYLPMLGEPWLRWKLRQHRGRVTVPAYIGEGARLLDSEAIARHVEQHMPHKTPHKEARGLLFPPTHDDAIGLWNQRAERLMHAGRALAVGAMMASREAVAEAIPKPLKRPAALQAISAPMAAVAVRFIGRKYKINQASAKTHREHMREVLNTLRAQQADGRPHLLGDQLTFADIAMCSALDFLKPSASSPLQPATRACWTRPELCAEYPDLLAWRDALDAQKPSHTSR